MRIVITGIAGHIGSRFSDWVLKSAPNIHITGIDNLSCGYYENIPVSVRSESNGHRFLQIDLTRIEQYFLDDWFKDVDVVFHFAAYAAEGLSPFIRSFNYENNLVATTKVVNACINGEVRRLVYTSSIAVYGRGKTPFYEASDCCPIDPYGVAKLACEQDIRIAGEQHGLDWCILRPHNIYGPYQSIWQKYRNVFGIWMNQYLSGDPITIFGDGEQKRSFTYIGDCLKPLWEAGVSPEASKEIINMGGEKAYSINEAAGVLEDVIGERLNRSYQPQRHEVKEAFCGHLRSHKIGYKDETRLNQGLGKMWYWAEPSYDYYTERQDTHDVAELEVTRGLYDQWK